MKLKFLPHGKEGHTELHLRDVSVRVAELAHLDDLVAEGLKVKGQTGVDRRCGQRANNQVQDCLKIISIFGILSVISLGKCRIGHLSSNLVLYLRKVKKSSGSLTL